MKNKKVYIKYLFICLFGLLSCEYEIIEPVKIDLPTEISFTNDVIPVFNNSCNMTGCHTQGHFKVDLTPANAYADIFAKNLIDTANAENSILYSKLVETGSSHLDKSEPGEPEIILEWIKQGAKNN